MSTPIFQLNLGHERMIQPTLYKMVMRNHAASVVVISFRASNQLRFMTATSFVPVSLDPPLVLFCVHKTNDTHEFLDIASRVGISILAEHQETLSRRFAAKGADRYNVGDLEIRQSPDGTSLLAESCAMIDAEILEKHDAGDHSIFVCGIVWAETNADASKYPLVYHSGKYACIKQITKVAARTAAV